MSEEAQEELVVLESLFGDQFSASYEPPFSHQIEFTPDNSADALTLKFALVGTYPTEPPVVALSARWLNPGLEAHLTQLLRTKFQPGQVCIYDWIAWLTENAISASGLLGSQAHKDKEDNNNNNSNTEKGLDRAELDASKNEEEDSELGYLPGWLSGPPLLEHKSKFVAHICPVNSRKEASQKLEQVKQSKKLQTATHNISVFRFVEEGQLVEERDDDGEGGAGDKLVVMFRSLEAVGVLVVVSRWYGGVQLGPDRFKLINKAARDVYQQFLEASKEEEKSKVKLRTSEDVFNRLKWDQRWEVADIVIGYMDRFDGMQETTFPMFEILKAEIPWHRVWYYKKGDEMIWDRAKRQDRVFGPAD